MNRRDSLEDFIWNNKEALDVHTPSNDLWSRIENELDSDPPPSPKKGNKMWAWIITGAIVLLASTAYFFFQLGQQRENK